jgi:hypothetical protein
MVALNGWQRLWVAVTVFWTVAVPSVGYATWPSPSACLDAQEAGVVAIRCVDIRNIVALASERGLPESEIRRLIARYDEQRNLKEPTFEALARAGEMLDSERQALRDDRVEHVQTTLMSWAIPPVVLYAFGWSAGWIRRGFWG